MEDRKDKIFLNDILNLTEDEIENSKISLCITAGKGGKLCIEKWLEDKDTRDGFWSNYGKQHNFKLGQWCFVFYKLGYGGNLFLLVAAGEITNVPENESASFEPIPRFQKYVGRMIVEVHKGNTYARYNFNLWKYLDNCVVTEICDSAYRGKPFPGYDNLVFRYEELKEAIYVQREWGNCLKGQKGVYVIVDTAPDEEYSGLGRIYVGSATSQRGMLFDRWKCYVDTFSGGNKELEKVKKVKGKEYIKKYFQWSLVEHFDGSVPDDTILKREHHWKRVLNSYDEGLNDNR